MLPLMTSTDPFALLEDELSAERKKVDVSYHDFSIRELVRMLTENELNISPEYQRKFRWKPDVASTLMDSNDYLVCCTSARQIKSPLHS